MYNIGFELFFYICHYRVYGLEVVPKPSTRKRKAIKLGRFRSTSVSQWYSCYFVSNIVNFCYINSNYTTPLIFPCLAFVLYFKAQNSHSDIKPIGKPENVPCVNPSELNLS